MLNPPMEIVDAEIVDEKMPAPGTQIAVSERVDLVVRRMSTVAERTPSALWVATKFLLRALTVDLWKGVCFFSRVWWRWKILATQTERAMTGGKAPGAIEEKLQERRERRTVMSWLGLFVFAIAALLFWWLAPIEWWPNVRVAGAVVIVLLFLVGHQWRQSKDAPADERPPGYDPSAPLDSIRRAFLGAGLIKRATASQPGQSVWFTPNTKPERVGEGVQVHLELDSGVTVADIVSKKKKLGSGLGADSDFMVIEKGAHDGQAKLWFAEDDPYRHGAQRSPLMDVERWDSWKAAPFGRTPHGFEIPLTLMYSNYLGGGSPGSGKSWTGRAVAAPFILDPEARIFLANGKTDGTWKAIRNICGDFYLLGTREETMQRLADMLDMLIEEMERRWAIAEARDASKIVPEDGCPPWLVIVDELQWFTTCSIPSGIKRGKKELTWGEVVTEKLTILVKGARSSAIILALMTQKPGEASLPTDLRDPIGTRFANRVGNGSTSTQILGLTTGDGVDASTLPAKHTGIGILVPDAELSNAVSGYPILRPYTINDDDWKLLGERGYALRREAGTHGYVRLSEQDAMPLPELLEAILEHVVDLGVTDRVSSNELRMALAPDMNPTAFGRQLRKWGCPSGRDNGKQAMGPRVGDIRAAAQRIREGGSVEVLKSA